jgi:solute carrier family 10 (sodium/bile acid cotransporter), member 7
MSAPNGEEGIPPVSTDDAKAAGGPVPDQVALKRSDVIKKKLLKHHLVLGLLFGLVFGWTVPSPGLFWGSIIPKNEWVSVSNLHVFIIFLISGSGLKTTEIKKALSEWKAVIYGIFTILILTACMGGVMTRIPLSMPELAYGLGVFCCVPTTMSSGVILVGQGDGNTSLGLLLTVATSLLGVITIPFMLFLAFSSLEGDTSININVGTMVYKLALFVALPLGIGKCVRHSHPRVPVFRTVNKLKFKLTSSLLLIMIPWMKVSSSVDKMNLLSVELVVACILLGALMHLVFLAVNLFVAKFLLELEQPEQIALTILGSQKTLGITVTVVEFLPDSLGAKGVILVPCIFAHFVQILIDGILISHTDKIFWKGSFKDCLAKKRKQADTDEAGKKEIEMI